MTVLCPSCRQPAPRSTYPSKSSRGLDNEGPDIAWWCAACLAEKVAAAHADDCRCGGCAGHTAPDFLYTVLLILFIIFLLDRLGVLR